jgi:nucleotide-binding universal stress UspA family protein
MSWTYPPMAAAGYAAGGGLPRAEAMDDATAESLRIAVDGVEAPAGVTIECRVLEGPAASVLLAESEDADVLVIGKRGHGGFFGLLLGSVATQVTNHASCAVVVVPHE